MAEVFAVAGLLPTDEAIQNLKSDFKEYKEGKRVPAYFGRDGDFSRHSGARLAELRHLHLAERGGAWPSYKRQNSRTSDRWLIYCPGFWRKDTYLLIAILEPDAHKQAGGNTLMEGLARIAEDFRAKY